MHHPISGDQARDFAVIHEKLFHLFVISRDLEEFAHIHPERHADGSFTIEHTLPKPGHYQLFADFLPLGGGSQITGIPIATAGVDTDIIAARAKLTPDAALAKTVDGVEIEVLNERSTILGGEEVDLMFKFTDAATERAAHRPAALSRRVRASRHPQRGHDRIRARPPARGNAARSAAPPTGGPEVLYDALLPKPGRYRAWLQFQRKGKLSTVVFTFSPRPGDPASTTECEVRSLRSTHGFAAAIEIARATRLRNSDFGLACGALRGPGPRSRTRPPGLPRS